MRDQYRILEDSDKLKSCHTIEDLKVLYPECRELMGKMSHTFFELEKDLYCRVFFLTKDGMSLKYISSFKGSDVDWDRFEVDYAYVKNGTHTNLK